MWLMWLMLIIYLAHDSHEMKRLVFSKKKLLSAAAVTDALRVKINISNTVLILSIRTDRPV